MLKTQKNELLSLIVDVGMQPTDFHWPSQERIEYVGPGAKPREFFFDFAQARTPGCHPSDFEVIKEAGDTDWDRHRRWFRKWLAIVQPEVTAPDLWAQVDELRAAVTANAVTFEYRDDKPLVDSEYKRLVAGLQHVAKQAEARDDLASDQLEAIQASLDRIEHASATIGAKDVMLVVLGAVAGVVFGGALTLANGQWLLAHLIDALTAAQLLAAPQIRSLGS